MIQTPDLVDIAARLSNESDAYISGFLEVRKDAPSPTYQRLITILKKIIDRSYTDGVDRFLGVKVDDAGNISGYFADGAKTIEFTLKGNNLSTKLARVRTDSLAARFDRKKRNCQKGHPCKGSCISKNKTCLAKLGEVASPGEVAQLRQAAVNLKLEQNAANKSLEPAPDTPLYPITPAPPTPPKQDYQTNPDTGKPYTIRELKKVASQKGVVGYSSMTTEELRKSLIFVDETPPEQQQRLAKTIASDRSTGSRAINASGVSGRQKRSLKDSNRTWKNLQTLAKFAGSQPVGWGAAAIGAFILGASIRQYERAKGEYRSHFKEAAEEAQERAANLGSSKNGLIQRTQKNNITFLISAGKGAGSDAIQKELEKYKDSEDEGDQWLANNHHFIPFNLKESGAKPGGNDIENSVNGLTDYLTNFKRGKDQDAVDLAAQIYAYGIQRKQPESVATGLRKIQGRHETLIRQEGKLQSKVESLEKLLESQKNPIQKRVIESRLAIAQSAVAKNQVQKRNNRTAYAKLEKEGDKKLKPALANKGKNINILAHSRAGQTSKTAMEYLARMQLPGEPTGKEVLEQVNLVMLGTPHFGFTENVSKRQRTLISAQDPISTLPVFGEGARQQWISTVKGHGWENYLEEPRSREAIREVFGYYEDSLLERRRKEEKAKAKGDSVYLDSYLRTLARIDAKKAVCKTGKPCKTESGKVVCIPKSHKCASEKVGLAQSKTPFYQNRNFQIGLAAAGVSALMVGGALAGAVALVKHDLEKSKSDFTSIRQPPGGIPDAQTLAKYDKLQPGDLIRKHFKSDDLGMRSHYAVYIGKDPKTGEHTLIDTGKDWKSRDDVPYVRSRGLTWDAGPNDTEYEKVPPEEMNLVKGTKQLTREEIVERSQKMLYQTFKYEGFESNCEAFARGMVEGKAYSSQGLNVSPLTNFTSRIVTDKVISLRAKAEGEKASAFKTEGETVKVNLRPYKFTGVSDYAKDKHKMTAAQMVDYLEREAVMAERRKWEEKINPYKNEYEPGYLTHLQESQKEANKAAVIKEQDKDLVARNTIKPFNRFAITVRVDKVKKDSEVEDFLTSLGMRSPEEFNKIVEQITEPFGEMKEAMQIKLYKDYLLMLFALLNQDLGIKADSYWEGFNSVRLDKINCQKGKPCKAESGKEVCIPKSHKCATESNPVDKKSLAIAGGGLVAGAGMVAAYAAARDILTTINTEDISRGSLSVTTSEEAKNIKVGKALDSQGATSKVYFAQDPSGRQFIFKQSEKLHYYQAASEVVVSDMAEQAGVKANKTKLIPVDVEHPKKDNDRAVTLHSLVPGKELSEVQKEGMFNSVNLRQKEGLTEETIKSMAQHKDLPKIAALDTFTSNWDRNSGNYFYDKVSDSFSAIDLGVSYSRVSTQHASVAQQTRNNIRKIDVQRLTDKEKQALNDYTQTLKSLYTNNPPSEIVKNHAKYLKLAGGNWDVFRRYISVKQIYDDHHQVGRLIYDLEQKTSETKKDSAQKCVKGKKCNDVCIPKTSKCRDKNFSEPRSPINKRRVIIGSAIGGVGLASVVGGIAIANAFKTESSEPSITRRKEDEVFTKTPVKDKVINGIPLESADADCYLKKPDNTSFVEPPYPKGTKTQKVGVVVVEPDGRFWVMEPTNHVGGTHNFAKGGVEEGLSLQQNAMKEAREELGLDVDIVDRLGDFDDKDGTEYSPKDTSKSGRTVRYYMGVRRGGSPADSHWETDKVKLVSSDSARKLFSKGNDRRELSVIKKVGEYTTTESQRMKLVDAYSKNEQDAQQRTNWKPKMSPEEAEEWAKNSDYKEPLYHVTRKSAADNIEKTGFRTDITLVGAAFGRGVYAGKTVEDINHYAKGYGDDGVILNLKVNAKKVLRVNDALKEAVEDKKQRSKIQENWNYQKMKYIAKHLNFEQDYLEAVDREKKRRRRLEAKQRRGKLTESERQNLRKHGNAESEAFSQLVQRAGYDAVSYRNGLRGADHFLIFDAKKVTITGRGKPVFDSAYWDSYNETMARFDGRGKRCGKGYIPADAECKQGQSQVPKRKVRLKTPVTPVAALAGAAAIGLAGGAGIAVAKSSNPQNAEQQAKKSKIQEAGKRVTNSLRKTGEVAQGLFSEEKTPKVIKKANEKVNNSVIESIKDDPELLNELIDSAKRDPKLVKGLLEMQVGQGMGTFVQSSIKDPGARKVLAKIATKPKVHQSIKNLTKETVDYIVRKDSSASDEYISAFVITKLESLVKYDAKGKRCGRGYIPANAKCKLGSATAGLKSPSANLNTSLAATGAIAGVAALGLAGGALATSTSTNLKQAKLERQLAEEALRKAEEIKKQKEEEEAKAKEEEEKRKNRTLGQDLKSATANIAASALEAAVPGALAGAAVGPKGAIAGGLIAGGVAAGRTASQEFAQISRKRKPGVAGEVAGTLIENLPSAVEIATDKTKSRKQRAAHLAGSAATVANQRAVTKLRNYAKQ